MSPRKEKISTPRERRETVRELLLSRRIATQDELRQLLVEHGIHVTQATLSRDLARLGARHTTLPDGGPVYELEELPVAPMADPVLGLPGIVHSIADNGALVVLHTQPGAASAIARSIDRARLPGALGTLAGDDTIFVAPATIRAVRQLRDTLRQFLGKAVLP